MGWNRQDHVRELDTKPREIVPYCKVHNKFQTRRGRWVDAGLNQEDLNLHLMYTRSDESVVQESICDKCDNPDQQELWS